MSNRIYAIEINDFLLDQFLTDGPGFPDHTMLNPETGLRDPLVLERMLGITRAMRRADAAKHKSGMRMVDYLKYAPGRMLMLINDLHSTQQRINKKSKAVEGFQSWEMLVLRKIDIAWFDPANTAAQRFEEFSVEDRNALETMAEPRLSWMQGLKKCSSEIKDFMRSRWYYPQLAGMVGLLLDRLTQWDTLGNDDRQVIADGVYACATPFGSQLLGLFVTLQPELMGFYTEILKDAKASREQVPAQAPDEELVVAPLSPLSLDDLYNELFQLAEKAKSDSNNLQYAEQIELLITANLPRLKQEHSLGEDTIRNILSECIELLEGIGSSLAIPEFSDNEFLIAFRSAWFVYFNNRLLDEVPETLLTDLTVERQLESEEINQRLRAAEAYRNSVEVDLDNLNSRLEIANFREKNELRNCISLAEESRVRGRKEHQQAEQDGCNLLLPPGLLIDSLPEGHAVELTPASYHPTAKAALGAWERPLQSNEALVIHAPVACPGDDETASVPQATIIPEASEPDIDAPLDDQFEQLAVSIANDPMEVVDAPQSQEPQSSIDDDIANADALPTEAVADSPTEEGVNVSQFLNTPTESCERLDLCKQSMSAIPAIAVENIALLWIKEGHLPLACKTLEVASRMGLTGELLSLPLVQAAYRGAHVWRGDTATVSRVQQSMNQLSSEVIESWIYRRPGGRVVPYLVFSAAFQPTLFCGNLTNAPRLLASVATNFDGPIARLIEEVVDFASHNLRFDLDTLRDQPTSNDKEARAKLSARIVEWHDRIQNKQTGWAPARKAMKECLEHEEFALTYRSITKDDSSALDEVRAFADKYRDQEEQSLLMHAEILKVMNESTAAPQIEGNARNWFLRTLDEVVSIADLWIEGHALQGQRNSELSKFAPRFLTMVAAALNQVTERINRTVDLEHLAGLQIVENVLRRISHTAENLDEANWEGGRITGWLAWPAEWLASLDADEADHQMELLCSLLEHGMDDLALAERALEQRNFRHALLLTLHHQDSTGISAAEKIEVIKRMFSEEVYLCNNRSVHMRGLLDNANVASLIDDERHYQLRGELEHLQDQLKNLKMLDDLCEIHRSLDELESSITAKFTLKKEELQASLDALINQALIDHGVDWVPLHWLEQIDSALAQHDTTVAEEMLEHLKHSLETGTSLADTVESSTELLKQFLKLEPQLYAILNANPNPREVIRHLAGEGIEGLSLDTLPGYFKRAIEDLVGLRRRLKGLDKATYEELVHVMHAIGLEAVTPTFNNTMPQRTAFSTHNKFSHFAMPVKRRDTGRGIVFFNQKSEEQAVNILMATGDWTVAELRVLLSEQTQFLHDRTILISGKELSNDERNELAFFSKRERHSLLHVDPVLLAMLAGLNVPETARLKTFLQLSLPWTFCNPYTGNQMQPAPPEMRYGRQNDIKMLTTMRNGAAMIFGGRQLGKTTLLNETQRRFHNPDQRHHAYLHQMDGNLDRANLSGDELEKHRKYVWKTIYNDAVSSGLVKEAYNLDTAAMVAALQDYFRRENSDAFMICLDEIDPILGLDAANGFRIFRELSGLVNNSNGRFKVVIAGLENVRRFADAPNYPLHQLGSAIQVSIMSPVEALQLIREPLGYLGYEFDTPLLMNRILVETNRHPGLIHIVCHELIQTLSARHQSRIGSLTITAEDIEQIRKDPAIRQLICDRFDITLNLDLRYKLIAYSLIAQSTSSFSPSRAKAIVEEWAPEIFEPMTEAQFEAFLDELCGLGVLQYMRRTEGGKEYALRNANILNLVGGLQKIEDKLLGALDAINDNDPLSAHAFPEKAVRPSPLTLRDEKLLISEEKSDRANVGTVQARSSNYSVGIITGSEALGLNPLWMVESLLAIGEEEPSINNNPYGRYHPAHKKDTEFSTAGDFKKMLNESVMGVQALNKHIMLFIELTGDQPISKTLDLLDIAHEARLNTNTKRNRVRVIFLMTPRALWQWETHPLLTAGREAMQPFVALDVWKKTALAHLLNKLELENTSTSVDTLESFSQGWYFSLDRLLDAKKKKPDQVRISSFGQAYSPLLQAKPKSMDEFLVKAGVSAVDWARPVLTALCEEVKFDEDDFELQLMEHHSQVKPQEALRWLSRLRLIVPDKVMGKKSFYRVAASIKAALLAKSAQEVKV
ncbi:hypothetical protein [Pseudomonas sp. MWU318]|uniref:hypothetical protein n=1 Tax=Pseudomonas sp. MWU318 TaxID=2802569 RepID=UPI001F492D95|nr:hypothetical protein [Pseudomonas sp. MWU318]